MQVGPDVTHTVRMSELYVVRHELIGVGHVKADQIDANEHAKLAYATYGAAVYFANVLEVGLMNVLGTAEVIAAKEAGQRIVDPWDRMRQKKMTMGSVLTAVKGKNLIGDPGLTADLDQALKRRNHLAHDFWHDRIEDMYSVTGRDKLIDELESDRIMFDKTNEILNTAVLDPLIRKAGVSQEQVDGLFEQTRRRAEGKDD
ncbi:hypothetical protein [Streptomyces sp. NPDC002851]